MRHLRDYQIRTADKVEREWLTNTSTLAVMATGTGKTVTFAEIIRRRQPGRALVLAHREELVMQAREKIERFAGLPCDVEMADMVASSSLFHKQPVVIATVQTMCSGRNRARMERFDPMDFSTLIIDEAHHAPAASFRKVIDYFVLGNPKLRVLGVTATPDRADEAALGQVCQSVAMQYDILDAINDGWLAPVEQQVVTIDGMDFSHVRTTAGDLNGADLAAVMEAEKPMQGVCAATLDIIDKRQTILFAASVKQAEMSAAIFNRHSPGCADWVCGATDKEQRRRTMRAMHDGRLQILCNVGVATEGFDCPTVSVIAMARKTKSRALYAQMAGRGTRVLPGVVDGIALPSERRAAIAASAKPACLIIDFAGNAGRHKLITAIDVLGGKYSEEEQEMAHKIMEREGGRRRVEDVLGEAADELIEGRKREQDEKRRAEEARKVRLIASARFVSSKVNPFDAFDIRPVGAQAQQRDAGRTLSEKQANLLRKQGVDPDKMSYTDAKRLLDEQFRRWNSGLCSMKQAALLKRYGYETSNMTGKRAKSLIDALAANGWKKF